MTLKSRLKLFFIILFVLLIFIGCSPSNKDTIRFAFFASGPFDTETEKSYMVLSEAIKRFENDNPNVNIEFTTGVRKEDYLDYLNTVILMGEIPDVMMISSEDIYKYIDLHMLEILDGYTNNLDKYYKCAVESGQYNDKLYGLPFQINPTIMAVNNNILQKVNIEEIDVMWTTQDLYDISSVIADEGYIPVYNYTWQHVNDTHSEQIIEASHESYTETSAAIEDIDYVYSLDLLHDSTSLTLNDFEEGKVAFTPMTYSQYILYKKNPYNIVNYVDFQLSSTSMPRSPEGGTISTVDSILISMSKFSANKQLAYEFMEFICLDSDVQMDIFKYSSGVSPVKEVVNSMEVAEITSSYFSTGATKQNFEVLDYMLNNSRAKPKSTYDS